MPIYNGSHVHKTTIHPDISYVAASNLIVIRYMNCPCLAFNIRQDDICSLGSTRLFLFDKPKLFSFPTAQSLSTVALPKDLASASFLFFSSSICSLYSLTVLAGSKANDALFKNCLFQFWRVFPVTSYFADSLLSSALLLASPILS